MVCTSFWLLRHKSTSARQVDIRRWLKWRAKAGPTMRSSSPLVNPCLGMMRTFLLQTPYICPVFLGDLRFVMKLVGLIQMLRDWSRWPSRPITYLTSGSSLWKYRHLIDSLSEKLSSPSIFSNKNSALKEIFLVDSSLTVHGSISTYYVVWR